MRVRPSSSQAEELRNAYIIDPHPTKEQREELGKRIGMCVGLIIVPCLWLTQTLYATLSSGATRVSRIGFKISGALQKSDWMMTLRLIRCRISIAMAARLQIGWQTWCLTPGIPENYRPSKRQLSPHGHHIRLSRLSYAGTSGRLALNVPLHLLRRGVPLIIVSFHPIVQDARGQSLIN